MAQKRIRMVQTYANARERLVQDKEYTIDSIEAGQLVRNGVAVDLDDPSIAPAPPDTQTSVQPEPPVSQTSPAGGKGAGKRKR